MRLPAARTIRTLWFCMSGMLAAACFGSRSTEEGGCSLEQSMQHYHSVNCRILELETRAADLMVRLALLQPGGERAQLDQVRRDLDRVLLDVREAHGHRACVLETLGMPPVLGWASRNAGCAVGAGHPATIH